MPLIRLESSDGVVFDADAETAKCSGTIKNMLENCNLEDGEEEKEQPFPFIPVPNVNSTILKKVLIWAKYHQHDVVIPSAEDEAKQDGKPEEYHICQWDADFLATVDQGTLFELIIAANYLDIRPLMNAACQTVANMIKGHTPAEIRRIFNIPRDATEGEEDEEASENESTLSTDSEDN